MAFILFKRGRACRYCLKKLPNCKAPLLRPRFSSKMAEIVGASASTIALIETSAKILSHLCGYISKVKNADKRWQKLTDEVEATKRLVDQLQINPNNERLD